jgi:hypothetical protein
VGKKFFGFTYLKMVERLLGLKSEHNNCFKDLNLQQLFLQRRELEWGGT